jgi:chemotaxis protein CheD
MIRPLHPMEVFLQPGEYFFASRDTRIRTLLGSCVSMIFWHPRLLIGGMCHYMLPERRYERRAGDWPEPNGRFADEAIALLLAQMDKVDVPYKEYQVKIFGGGNMFPQNEKKNLLLIGEQNIEAARRLVKQHGFTCVAEHLGGIGHRNVLFEVWNGGVWVKHCDVLQATGLEQANRWLG